MRLAAGAFMGGAVSRLLPASIPFRFFAAAVVYHLLAWIALAAGAPAVPRFTGGLGWPLAALHLVTLGVLAMTAIGASLQLLPVATRQPVPSQRLPAVIWWLYTPGVAATALGMGIPAPRLLAGGAVAVVAALAGYALLLARNLIGARGMPVVVAHGWAALASLFVVLASGSSLAGAYVGLPGFRRGMALAWHVSFAAYGFMGLLVLGLSYILCRCSPCRRRRMNATREPRSGSLLPRCCCRPLRRRASRRRRFASPRSAREPARWRCTGG